MQRPAAIRVGYPIDCGGRDERWRRFGNSGRASGALPDTGCFECAGASARAGQSPAVVENGTERRLAGLVRQEELSEILQRATQQSAYACTQSLRQGFVTLPGGHRIGVCGSAVVKNGELAGYQALSSLCIRFARDVRMDSARLLPNLTDSCLILGAPGAGKTTLLRACIRALSESGQRVSVCDDGAKFLP